MKKLSILQMYFVQLRFRGKVYSSHGICLGGYYICILQPLTASFFCPLLFGVYMDVCRQSSSLMRGKSSPPSALGTSFSKNESIDASYIGKLPGLVASKVPFQGSTLKSHTNRRLLKYPTHHSNNTKSAVLQITRGFIFGPSEYTLVALNNVKV